MNHVTGDLRLITSELDMSTLTSEDGDQKVIARSKDTFQVFLEERLPKAVGRAVFSSAGIRGKHESMNQCIARKRTLLQELKKSIV